MSELLKEACEGREADPCKIVLATVLHLQSRHEGVSTSMFCLCPGTIKVKGKTLVKEWCSRSQFSLPFKATNLRS